MTDPTCTTYHYHRFHKTIGLPDSRIPITPVRAFLYHGEAMRGGTTLRYNTPQWEFNGIVSILQKVMSSSSCHGICQRWFASALILTCSFKSHDTCTLAASSKTPHRKRCYIAVHINERPTKPCCERTVLMSQSGLI